MSFRTITLQCGGMGRGMSGGSCQAPTHREFGVQLPFYKLCLLISVLYLKVFIVLTLLKLILFS